jgi:Fe-S cluster biogenesis protein NfuA
MVYARSVWSGKAGKGKPGKQKAAKRNNRQGDKQMKEKVETALNKIRPSLNADGGDVKLIDVSDDGVVKVQLTGACGGCPMSQMTLKMGIEKVLREEIPEVKEVVGV